ncbi:hypothetical protein CB1_000243053 [Camelus ferus]|nr:hypothetical protein CB1_000243053 [Camelus ferus]
MENAISCRDVCSRGRHDLPEVSARRGRKTTTMQPSPAAPRPPTSLLTVIHNDFRIIEGSLGVPAQSPSWSEVHLLLTEAQGMEGGPPPNPPLQSRAGV